MNIQKELDLAIRDFEVNEFGFEFGFSSKKYENYLSNAAWSKFYDDMARYNIKAFSRYSAGSGGEMVCGENGSPPKMASFGSSSRMIYNLVMKDEVKERFLFEEKLSTTIGGTANLDGFMQKGNTYIFVEAKCREPYASKKNSIKDAYKPLYEYISVSPDVNLFCACGKSNNKKEMPVDFKYDVKKNEVGKIIKYFDMKQMICHLLAVGTAVLTNHYEEMKNTNDEDIKINFIYLIYDPRNLDFEYDDAKIKIVEIYESIFSFCKGNENQFFKDLFKVILRFLQTEKKLGATKDVLKIINNFNFYICSQDDFKEKCKIILEKQ